MPEKLCVLIAGGAGYIGSHTVKLLLASNHEVIIFDNLSTGHASSVPTDHLIIGDLADVSAIEDCFKSHRIDIVMHFASSIIVSESVVDPAKYYQNNVINTINLLNVMKKYHVNYFIFSSTAAVYGNPLEIPISIHHPKNPINPYGKSKAMVEQIVEDYHHAYGLHYIFFRYFNAAGADPSGTIGECHEPETHLIPLALQVAKGERDKLIMHGDNYETKDGTCIRDYVHVCDIADAHLRAMHYVMRTNQSHCFNLGTAKGYSVKEVINAVERVTKRKVTVEIADRRPGDPPILVADAVEANHVLHWQPTYTKLDDIIKHAWGF